MNVNGTFDGHELPLLIPRSNHQSAVGAVGGIVLDVGEMKSEARPPKVLPLAGAQSNVLRGASTSNAFDGKEVNPVAVAVN